MDPRDYPEKVRRSKAPPNAHRVTKPSCAQKQAYIDDMARAVRRLHGLEGKPFAEVAKELGISIERAHHAFWRSCEQARNENVAEVRARGNANYEAIIATHMPLAMAGNVKSGQLVVDTTAKMMRLNGAEAPEVKDITIRTEDATPAAARRVMQELFGGNVGPDTADDESASDAAIGAPDHRSAPPGAPTH